MVRRTFLWWPGDARVVSYKADFLERRKSSFVNHLRQSQNVFTFELLDGEDGKRLQLQTFRDEVDKHARILAQDGPLIQ